MYHGGRRGMLMDVYPFDLYEDNGYFYLNSFLPAIPANDLIKECLKLICSSLYPSGNRFLIRPNHEVLASTSTVNWSSKQIGKLTLSDQPGQAYVYGYTNTVPPTSDSDQENVVNTIHQMFQYPMGDEKEMEIYVKSTKELYRKTLREKPNTTADDRFEFELLGSSMGLGIKESGFEMKSELTPIPMSVYEYWADHYEESGIPFGSWYVPDWEGERKVRPDKMYIGLYHGLQDAHTELPGGSVSSPNRYPLLAPHNYNAYGQRQGELSLEWEGPYGLINLYHRAYMNYMEASKRKCVASLSSVRWT